MSRFGNLEFDSNEQRRGESVRHRPATDENRSLAEAQAAFGRAEFEPALRWYGKVLEFNPSSIEGWTGQVRALIELGQYHAAKVWADKGLDQFPQAPELLAAKGVALGRLGDTEIALTFSDAALDNRSSSPYVWLARADVLLSRQERQVDYCFDRALELAPADWFVRWLGARIRAFWKQFAAALKLAREAAGLAPERFAIWLLCGQCQLALGLGEAAATSFHQALALKPGCREAEEGLTQLRTRSLFSRIWSKWKH